METYLLQIGFSMTMVLGGCALGATAVNVARLVLARTDPMKTWRQE